jgi:hypothetical protein
LIKIVGVGNIRPPNFGGFIDLIAPQSGVLRKDFPPDWSTGPNLLWYESPHAEQTTEKDIVRMAEEKWGSRVLGDTEHKVIVVAYNNRVIGAGVVGFFLDKDFAKREIVVLSHIDFNWSCGGVDKSVEKELSDAISGSAWYKRIKIWPGRLLPLFVEANGNLDLQFNAHPQEESDVREIEADITATLRRLGVKYKHRRPLKCRSCKRAVGEVGAWCPYCRLPGNFAVPPDDAE